MQRTLTTLVVTAVAGSAVGQSSISGFYLSDELFHYYVDGIPDFDQVRAEGLATIGLPNDGRFYCAPTAATNLMAWLANNGSPSLPPGSDEWSLYTASNWDDEALDRYNHSTNAIQEMAEAMETNIDGGTGSSGIVLGLSRTFETHLPEGLDEFRVHQFGVDGGDWVSRRHQIPRISAACQVLLDGSVAIMRWGYYNWTDVFTEGDELTARTGGHLLSVMGIDRVAGETYVTVRNPGSSDTGLIQSDFEVSRYRVEDVVFTLPNGEIDLRQVLMRPEQTWSDFTPGGIKCIDEFTFITPRHGLSVSGLGDALQLHRLDPFGLTVETEIVDLPAGAIAVRAALTPDQLAGIVATDEGAGLGSLLRYDFAAGVFEEIAPIEYVEALALTRHGTAIVLEGLHKLTHFTPHDPGDPVLAQEFVAFEVNELDVDHENDVLWMLGTNYNMVATVSLPDLMPLDSMFLPSAISWNGALDFEVSPGGASFWIVNDGALVQVRVDQDPPAAVWYDVPLPVESITVDEGGAVTLTMLEGPHRVAKRFEADPDAGTLTVIPSTLLNGLDVGRGFHLTSASTNVDPALFENPGSDDLDVETIADTFNDPEPSPAGELCEHVDEFEDLAHGDPVTERVLAGVSIDIATDTGAPIHARNWGAAGTNAFDGAGGFNEPFAPGQVSGDRFISGADLSTAERFDTHQPIHFEFDVPVSGFGLTTVDLLESAVDAAETVALRAYDSNGVLVAKHERSGPQGPSGVVLRWHVHSGSANIVRVELGGTLETGGGYGLDDLELCRGACAGDLDGDAQVGLSDLLSVLASWGPCAGCSADFNGDGQVGLSDLLTVLASWGPCP